MQTAVEWLIEKMLDSGIGICKEWREQAKEMEKQQKIDFANNYSESDIYYCNGEFEIIKDAEQYYNETYGSKGSDEIKKAEEMGLYDKIELANPNDSISSQTEISDEEIEKEASHYIGINGSYSFTMAIKWYREQLKTK